MGTYMFFEKDDDPHVDDVVFDKVPTLKYFAKTRKVLKMQRVFSKPRTEIFDNPAVDSCIPNIDTLAQAGVPPKYQDEGIEFICLFMHCQQVEINFICCSSPILGYTTQ